MMAFSATNPLCRRLAGLSIQTANGASRIKALSSFLPQSFLDKRSPDNVLGRFLSSAAPPQESNVIDKQKWLTATQPQLLHTNDGRTFAAFDSRIQPKLKPYIVKRRLNRMRTYEGAYKNIRHSPWRLNLVCQLAAGLPLTEALRQLDFCKKKMAPLVQYVLKRTARTADMRDGLQQSQLEVAECFATKGTHLKRVKTMGRGRSGQMEHKHAHFRVVLREIDFKLRIYQAPSVNQKKRWYVLQLKAERDYARAKEVKEQIERLERETAAAAKKKS